MVLAASAAILSLVKPNFWNSLPAGADAPAWRQRKRWGGVKGLVLISEEFPFGKTRLCYDAEPHCGIPIRSTRHGNGQV